MLLHEREMEKECFSYDKWVCIQKLSIWLINRLNFNSNHTFGGFLNYLIDLFPKYSLFLVVHFFPCLCRYLVYYIFSFCLYQQCQHLYDLIIQQKKNHLSKEKAEKHRIKTPARSFLVAFDVFFISLLFERMRIRNFLDRVQFIWRAVKCK